MKAKYRIGFPHNIFKEDGTPVFKDIGLGLVETDPQWEYRIMKPHDGPVTPELIQGYDGIMAMGRSWGQHTFAEGADQLLVVARMGVGHDNCDIASFTQNDVLLTIAEGATDHPVAGGVVALMLALSRRLFQKDRLVRSGQWDRRTELQGTEMAGKTLGIVGLGGSGRQLSKLVQPWKMRVIGYDPFLSDEVFAQYGVEQVLLLEELFAVSDYISIHCPLNEKTHGIIKATLFNLMKPTAFFINASRGRVVNEADLIQALKQGKLAGAGLDVFEEEPPLPENPLLKMDKVIVTPHSICWTDECFQEMGKMAIQSIMSAIYGEKPRGVVNPEVLTHPGYLKKLNALRRR